ncbi:MAG: PAS domain-containing protein, partial [Vibrio fluvialis]
MSKPLRVLIIGNTSTEPSLIEQQLCKRWPALVLERVESVDGLQTALNQQGWDCVLCGMFADGGPDAAVALDVCKKSSPTLPFLILSDFANFENAISLLKNGADDFISKENLQRLFPAIEEALGNAEGAHKAEQETQVNERRLRQAQWRALINTLPDLVWLKDRQGAYLACNHRFERYLGLDEDEIIGKTDDEFMDLQRSESYREQDEKAMATGQRCINEEKIRFADDGHVELIETIKVPM